MKPSEELERLGDAVVARSEQLDRLSFGALLGAAGGFLVLGLVLGSVAWIPFGIALPMALFKGFIELPKIQNRQRIERAETDQQLSRIFEGTTVALPRSAQPTVESPELRIANRAGAQDGESSP